MSGNQTLIPMKVAAGMTVWGLTAGGHILPEDPRRLTDAGAHRIVGDWAEAAREFARWA